MDLVLVSAARPLQNSARIEKQYQSTPLVSGNVGKLSQICINILTNAVDAVEVKKQEDPVVTITAGEEIRAGSATACCA